MTVTLLCAVFATFSIPSPWVATEIKNLADRATVTITRQIKSGEAVSVPNGCVSPETPPVAKRDPFLNPGGMGGCSTPGITITPMPGHWPPRYEDGTCIMPLGRKEIIRLHARSALSSSFSSWRC